MMKIEYLIAWGFYAVICAVWGAVIAAQRAKTHHPYVKPEYTPVRLFAVLGAVGLCCAAFMGV